MCTGIPVFANGKLIFARTMEFTAVMDSQLYVVPKGTSLQATYTETVLDRKGRPAAGKTYKCKSWDVKYGFIGPNFLKAEDVIEGFNEKGLHVSGFYFPGYEHDYEPFPEKDDPKFDKKRKDTVTQIGLVNYLLSVCANTKEAFKALNKVRVSGTFFTALGKTPGVHWIVQDADGDCMVVEYLDNTLTIFDNPYGVITNSPSFDWHLTNMSNYVNLRSKNADPYIPRTPNGKKEPEAAVGPMGQGSGMLGLPGDFTSPSRFVRAVALSQAVDLVEDNQAGVELCWNLINNVDIAIGTIQFSDEEEKEGTTGLIVDYTQWVSVCDLGELKYYYRTYDNQNIRYVSLPKALAKAKAAAKKGKPSPIMTVPMENPKARYYNSLADIKPAGE